MVTRFPHTLDVCPCRAGELRRNAHFVKVVQPVDFGPPPLAVEEHTSPEYWCRHCHKGNYAAALPHI